MKIGQIVFALRADTGRLCKAMAKLNKAMCPKRAGDPMYEISPKRLLEQQQQEQLDDDYERTREFRCGNCGDRFNSARPDVEAICEMETVFGDLPESERAIVCQTCWDKMKALGIVPKEPSYNSIADEIASYRPHPTNPTGGGCYFT